MELLTAILSFTLVFIFRLFWIALDNATAVTIGNSTDSSIVKSGCNIIENDKSITLIPCDKIKPVDVITDIYPGFPTDLQAQWVVLMALAHGESTVEDTIYIDRFSHIPELNRLGASISLNDNVAHIKGVSSLYGAEVMSTDIRASASMILGAIAAQGSTVLSRIYHIDRGYEKIEKKLNAIGSDIKRVNGWYNLLQKINIKYLYK